MAWELALRVLDFARSIRARAKASATVKSKKPAKAHQVPQVEIAPREGEFIPRRDLWKLASATGREAHRVTAAIGSGDRSGAGIAPIASPFEVNLGGKRPRPCAHRAKLLSEDEARRIAATGFQNFETAIRGKWLDVLKEIAPGVRQVAFLYSPDISAQVAFMHAAEAASTSLGMTVTATAVQSMRTSSMPSRPSRRNHTAA